MWTSSNYNFAIPAGDQALLYNARSGAVIRLGGVDSLMLARWLSTASVDVTSDQIPIGTFEDLIKGGFIVPQGMDELAAIRDSFQVARQETPMVVTITTTMDCNLGCYYCYEERTTDALSTMDIDAIVDHVSQKLDSSNRRSLHVDWYGGEPLLNFDFLVSASNSLQNVCDRLGVKYVASVVSNGTRWPSDISRFVDEHRIRQVQISVDGMKFHHDRRRRYLDSHRLENESSSFDVIVSLVDSLLDHTRVDIRLNIDRGNATDIEPFISLARDRGWFDKRFPLVIQPARLASFSAHSSFMRAHELSIEEYDLVRQRVRNAVNNEAIVEECEAPDGFPYPRTSVCAALAHDSVVIGADRRTYRCGLQVGERHRSVGSLVPDQNLLPILQSSDDESFWREFDPTRQPTCSRCSFLPICWGGCPKKHLEKDNVALKEQGEYWRRNLPRLVANRFGIYVDADFIFTETDQFRCPETQSPDSDTVDATSSLKS